MRADVDDPVAPDRHIADIWLCARPVIDGPAADQHGVSRRRRGGGSERGSGGKRNRDGLLHGFPSIIVWEAARSDRCAPQLMPVRHYVTCVRRVARRASRNEGSDLAFWDDPGRGFVQRIGFFWLSLALAFVSSVSLAQATAP